MKTLPLLFLVFFNTVFASLNAKSFAPTEASEEKSHLLSLGYSTSTNWVFRYEYLMMYDKPLFKYVSIFADVGTRVVSFDKFREVQFNQEKYSSDSRLIVLSLGASRSFRWKFLSATPFFAIKYASASFTDPLLNEVFGRYSTFQRYTDETYTTAIGPPLSTSDYGSTMTYDIGIRLGAVLKKRLLIQLTTAYSPLRFDDVDTYYGKHIVDSLYTNPYWIKIKPLRFEVSVGILL